MANIISKYSTLTTGTVTLEDTQQDIVLIHDAVSLAATLTIVMPVAPVHGQRVTISSTLGVTLLTLTSTISVATSLSALSAAIPVTFFYSVTGNKWYRI